jgi:hypothetical protein
MAGGAPVGGVRNNPDIPRPFSGAWRVVAAQTIALGPRTGPLPRPQARGGHAASGAGSETNSRLSLDHLVGAQKEISTDRQSERSRCFEIDDELEFGGLLDRQVGGLRAFQNLVDVSGGA